MLPVALAAASVLVTSCVVAPPPAPPPHVLNETAVGLPGTAFGTVQADWWTSFDDPQLNSLMAGALTQSPTLAQARARLDDAASLAEIARAGLFPKANLAGSIAREHAPQNYVIPPPLAGKPAWIGQFGVSLGWDLDFWGKQADAVARARALTLASSLDVESSRLMIAGAIAQAYVELTGGFGS